MSYLYCQASYWCWQLRRSNIKLQAKDKKPRKRTKKESQEESNITATEPKSKKRKKVDTHVQSDNKTELKIKKEQVVKENGTLSNGVKAEVPDVSEGMLKGGGRLTRRKMKEIVEEINFACKEEITVKPSRKKNVKIENGVGCGERENGEVRKKGKGKKDAKGRDKKGPISNGDIGTPLNNDAVYLNSSRKTPTRRKSLKMSKNDTKNIK